MYLQRKAGTPLCDTHVSPSMKHHFLSPVGWRSSSSFSWATEESSVLLLLFFNLVVGVVTPLWWTIFLLLQHCLMVLITLMNDSYFKGIFFLPWVFYFIFVFASITLTQSLAPIFFWSAIPRIPQPLLLGTLVHVYRHHDMTLTCWLTVLQSLSHFLSVLMLHASESPMSANDTPFGCLCLISIDTAVMYRPRWASLLGELLPPSQSAFMKSS